MVYYPKAPQLAPHKLTSIVQAVPEDRHCRGIVPVTIHIARGCCWHCDIRVPASTMCCMTDEGQRLTVKW